MGTKQTGHASSIPVGLLIGTMSATVVTLIGCMLTAKLIEMEFFKQANVGYAVMVILIGASWMSGTIAYHKIKRQKLIVCVSSGLCFYSILLGITALVFGGQYSGVGETAILILCGNILAVFLKTNRRKDRKIKIRNR